MPGPPSSKQDPSDATREGLAEVERALSILHGRHPESERLRREDEERRAKRLQEQEAVARAEAARVRKRMLVIGSGSVLALALATAIVLFFRSELARRARLEQAGAPYRAMGFVLVDSTGRGEPSKLEANVPEGCVLAATTAAGARVKIAHAGGEVEGPAPVITCLCEGGRVSVTSDTEPGEGIVLLRADARAIGGSRAFAFLPFQPGAAGRSDEACAEDSLDAWLASKRWAQQAQRPDGPSASTPVDAAASDAWLAKEPARAVLRDVGFALVSTIEPRAPFGVVEIPAASCVVLAPEDPQDRPSLRLERGASAVGPAAGNVGWCTSTEKLALAVRNRSDAGEPGRVAVLIGPAARVGGLAGLHEIAEQAQMPLAAGAVAPADHGWNAKNLLLASAIPEAVITVTNTPALDADPDARLVALSVAAPGALVGEAPADVFSFCTAALDRATAAVCAFSGAHKWRVEGAEAVGGLARAKLPFWLFGLQGVTDPAALKVQTDLVTLARRLRREGFEPTTIAAVTELDNGAEVLGRANEDAFVAVGLAPTAPWVFPYSDGPAWKVDGEPRVIPIEPLQRIVVTSTAKPLPPKATRRTVVFRRQKR